MSMPDGGEGFGPYEAGMSQVDVNDWILSSRRMHGASYRVEICLPSTYGIFWIGCNRTVESNES